MEEIKHLIDHTQTLLRQLEQLQADLDARGLPTEGIETAEMV